MNKFKLVVNRNFPYKGSLDEIIDRTNDIDWDEVLRQGKIQDRKFLKYLKRHDPEGYAYYKRYIGYSRCIVCRKEFEEDYSIAACDKCGELFWRLEPIAKRFGIEMYL